MGPVLLSIDVNPLMCMRFSTHKKITINFRAAFHPFVLFSDRCQYVQLPSSVVKLLLI